MATVIQVVIDCADPARVAAFWASALGYVVQPPPEGFASWEEFLTSIGVPQDRFNSRSAVIDPAGRGPRIFFQQVPEPKTVKNRVHIDISASDGAPDEGEARHLVDAKVEELVGQDATVLRDFEEFGERTVVMQDPEGNEFCVQ
jgi:catechol 2,3-dioxygenase-like lactoylglutathione lyase family enzyme